MTSVDPAKQAAAEGAVAMVEDGMALGLGTGSTMAFALEALARRIHQEGLRVRGIPTSERTAVRARELGIPLTDFAETPRLDLDIDGADEVTKGSLAIIKGGGGALLREKIVAAASKRFVAMVDSSKIVRQLGMRMPLPVEVVAFGRESTARRLTALGGAPHLRMAGDSPFVTDGGNVIYDCSGFGPILAPTMLARDLSGTVGVVDHGLFLDLADTVIVGEVNGTITVLRHAGR